MLQDAALTVGNSIFNRASGRANISALGTSSVTSLGYNLSSDNFGGFLTGTGDQINTDPILGLLQNNGGPTKTHAPLSNSPALDRGKDLGPVGPAYAATGLDQRGNARPVTYLASIIAASRRRSERYRRGRTRAWRAAAQCGLTQGPWRRGLLQHQPAAHRAGRDRMPQRWSRG